MKIRVAMPEKYEPKAIGKCIYCGSIEGLTDEHIVPYSLGGPWQLLSASCKECTKITSKIERDVVKELFSLIRTKINLPTYHPKNRPTSFAFSVKINNKEEIVNFPANDCPALFMMPTFKKPGYILKEGARKGISFTGISLHGNGLQEFQKQKNIETLSLSVTFGVSFARLLAKIAYGMVIQELGLDKIKETYVIPCILGKKDDAGQWVGCEEPHKSPALLPREQFFHRIDVLSKNGEVGARIRLFATYQTPEYLIIVGRLKEPQAL
jgi:hypothetical protein